VAFLFLLALIANIAADFDTDVYDAFWAALRAVEKAGYALMAPPTNYGASYHHMAFPGTVSVSPAPALAYSALPM